MQTREPSDNFETRFKASARVVRRSNAFRETLRGLALGLVAAALCSGASLLWFDGRGRFWLLGLCVVGLVAGALVARHRRWNDEEVGLFLDARLNAKGSISTALAPERESTLLNTVVEAASTCLERAPATRPRLLERSHLAIPLSLAVLVPILLAAPKTGEPKSAPPGTEAVTVNELQGLKPLLALEQLEALDAEQQAKLNALADQARKLKAQVDSGVEQREAQAKIAQLQDEVDALLGELSNAENRAGLAAAIEALEREAGTRSAAQALGNGDLVRFDEEMRKLSLKAEKAARQAAQEALAQARSAAEKRGARALSSALQEQQKLFEQREHTAELLRELAKVAPSPLGQELQNSLDNGLSQPELDELGEALEKALKELTDEQRQALAENLKKAIEKGALNPNQQDAAELQRLAKQLERGHGQEELKEMLKQLAKPGAASKIMQSLRDAEKGLEQAQRQAAGALPVPQASPNAGQPAAAGNGREGPSSTKGGPGRGPGAGEHDGQTEALDTDELRALAEPRLDPSRPMMHASQGRTSARPGERALTPDLDALSAVSAEELQGVEHSSIPEEYREQVSRYFAP